MNDDIETLREAIIQNRIANGSLAALERVEKELEQKFIGLDLRMNRYGLDTIAGLTARTAAAETERDSLRALNERAKEALRPIAAEYHRTHMIMPSLSAGEVKISLSLTVSVLRDADAVLAELSDDAPAQQFKFEIGQPVRKVSGYAFDGHVRMRGRLAAGERYIVECDSANGLLHIFSDTQLADQW